MKNIKRKLENLFDSIYFEIRALYKLKWLRVYTYVWATVCLMLVVSIMSQYGSLLKADITQDIKESITFTGTVHPISGFESYDSDNLDPFKYSTAYVGNYLSYEDGELIESKEHGGSHAGVDIIIPTGTAVRSIANGVVIKSSNQQYGFGIHVCVLHPNVPSYSNKSQTTDYVSCYAHLSKASVAKNEIVSKGQVVGLSGETGTATTPHLHFQIDKENAPFHPYWPFTSTEASALGYDFWSAVNHGLGKSNVLAYTISPVVYTQLYGSVDSVPSAESKPAPKEPVYIPKLAELKLIHDGKAEVGIREILRIQALDEKGLIMKDYRPKSRIVVVDSKNLGSFQPDKLDANDFKNGETSFAYTANTAGRTSFSVSDGAVISQSEEIVINEQVVPEVNNLLYVYSVNEYKPASGSFELPLSKEQSVSLKIYNEEGQHYQAKGHNKTISVDISGDAKVTPRSFKAEDLEDGVIDLKILSFKTGSYVLTVNDGYKIHKVGPFVTADQEAGDLVKFSLEIDQIAYASEAEKILIRALDSKGNIVRSYKPTSLVLSSSDSGARFAKSPLFVADFENGVASTSVTFSRSGSFVVEAKDGKYKGVSNVVNVKVPEVANKELSNSPKTAAVFTDVPAKHTHFAAVKYLKDKGIVSGYGNGQFLPDSSVSRVEALKMIFASMNISVFSSKNIKSFDDVNIKLWYAPYVAEAKKRRIVNGYGDGSFRPDNYVSRVEAVKILLEVLGEDITEFEGNAPFSDIQPASWHASYLSHAKKTGLVNTESKVFNPNLAMTRGELASLIYRAIND